MTARETRRAAIARLRTVARETGDAFLREHAGDIERYRAEISVGLAEALAELARDVDAMSDADTLTHALIGQTREYIDWMQWTLWDLPCFAVVLQPEPERFRRSAVACGLVYLSFRVVDDLLDRHYLYRGKRSTLLATFTQSHGGGHESEGLTVLAALLLSFEGLNRLIALVEPGHGGDAAATLRAAVASARRTIVGAVMERGHQEAWSTERYQRLIELKNVDYWRILNAALDPDGTSPLHAFLTDYYTLAQRLNDVQDHTSDEARGQPNFVSILRGQGTGAPTMELVEEALARDFLRLAETLAALPARERGAAALKLAESLDEADRLGLFRPFEPADEHGHEPLRIAWDATAEEVLERAGPDALEDVGCAVCTGAQNVRVFRKHGFAYRRCTDCSHVYVSPRVRHDVRERIGDELDGLYDDPFLDVQRIQAEYLCRVLRRLARGPRLLDVGFGRGYLLHLAQAHGFEAYGVDSSAALLERLRPVFGRRLARAVAGRDSLPWGEFDVVVMSHVLEHLADPDRALEHARDALHGDGLLYVAVPDMNSVQFRIFGKRWDPVSPIVHLQYFTETSLRRLLARCGFEVVSRIEHPPEPPMCATPSTRLFRALGGSESGELGLLCRPASPAQHDRPAREGA